MHKCRLLFLVQVSEGFRYRYVVRSVLCVSQEYLYKYHCSCTHVFDFGTEKVLAYASSDMWSCLFQNVT